MYDEQVLKISWNHTVLFPHATFSLLRQVDRHDTIIKKKTNAGCEVITYIKKVITELRALGFLPTLVIKIGFILGSCYCLAALYAIWLLERTTNYFGTLRLAQSCILAAPGAVATAFLAAFICDYVQRRNT